MSDRIATLEAVLDEVRKLRAELARERRPRERAALSLRDAARRLGIDRGGRLRDLIDARVIQTIPWGTGGVRVPAREIERILAEGLPDSSSRSKPRRRAARRAAVPPAGVGARIRALTVED
jgi:hypothetical protein